MYTWLPITMSINTVVTYEFYPIGIYPERFNGTNSSI